MPAYEILIFISILSIKGSGVPADMRKPTRALAARIHNVLCGCIWRLILTFSPLVPRLMFKIILYAYAGDKISWAGANYGQLEKVLQISKFCIFQRGGQHPSAVSVSE